MSISSNGKNQVSTSVAIISAFPIISYMSHAGGKNSITSLDLGIHGERFLDVTHLFPFSNTEAIDTLEKNIDTVRGELMKVHDFSEIQEVRVETFTDFHTLDIAKREIAHSRGLTRSKYQSDDRYDINLCPPISIPNDALDLRGGPIVRKKRYSDLYRRSLPVTLHIRRVLKNTRATLWEYKRPILAFFIITLGLGIPSLVYVQSLVEGAFKELATLNKFSTPAEVIHVVHKARAGLERANIIFMPYRYIPENKIRMAKIAIDGGLSLTRGIDTVMSTIESGGSGTFIEDTLGSDNTFRPVAKDIRPLAFLGITEPTTWMKENISSITYLRNEMRKAGKTFEGATTIDHPKAEEIAHIGRGISKLADMIDFAIENEAGLSLLLGANSPERYIIFNQNRDEIRANGGFPGSVITFTMFKGNISDYRTDDVYYYDWNLYPFKELPPPGLALITGTYGLRDVNYYPNFRDTLEKANAFIERSGDPTVTVGIALHQGLIEDILGDIGGVTLSGISLPFTKDNFSELMSTLVESRYGEKTSAKDILSDFVPAFLAKIHEKRAYEEVLTHLTNSLEDGEILFASRNARIDNFLTSYKKPLPWQKKQEAPSNTQVVSGIDSFMQKNTLYDRIQKYFQKDIEESPIKNATEVSAPISNNWAYPVLTSLSGNKSDRFIERTYSATTTKLNACQVLNNLTFTHKHTFKRENEDKIRSYLDMISEKNIEFRNRIVTIEGKGKNVNYIRLLVPITSSLTGSTAGIETTATTDYREYAFTLETPLGATTSKNLTYVTQVPGCQKTEELSWYRQPGLKSINFTSR
ncbi:MAG: hypothetical protein HHAS10_03800 [Candidatus Altimarinota bacterium]